MSWLFDYLPNNFMYHTSGNTATGAYTWYCPSVSEKTRMTSTCINTWKHTVSLTQNEDIRTRCTPHGMHCRSGSCIQVIVKTHTMYKTRTIRWVFKNKRKIGLKHGFTVEIKKKTTRRRANTWLHMVQQITPMNMRILWLGRIYKSIFQAKITFGYQKM